MKAIMIPRIIVFICGVIGLIFCGSSVMADTITKPYTFASGTTASAVEVNANFDTVFDQVNKIGSVITTDSTNGRLGIMNENPVYTLDVKGSFRLTDDSSDAGNLFMLRTSQQNAAYAGGAQHDLKVFQVATYSENATNESQRWSFFLASPEISATESPYLYAFPNHNMRIGTIDNQYRRAEIELYNAGGVGQQGSILFRTGSWQDPTNIPYNPTNVRMILTGAGNVGIGTMEPNRLLTVNGDAGGTSAWYQDSDERLKKDINTIENALERVQKLRGVEFEWRDTEKHPEGKQMGFIAQEAIDVVPEVIDQKGEYYSMQYAPMNALLVESIKDLKAENDSLKAKYDALKRIICEDHPDKAICRN